MSAPPTAAVPLSQALQGRVALLLPQLSAAVERVWSAAPVLPRYAAYLCTMHSVIRASVPLMETALRACADLPRSDPVAPPLAAYLAEHVREERGHDEWLRQDLAALGRDPDRELGRTPSPSAATLVGAQYYWILHHHPACLLGYIWVLEGYPPPPSLADRLAAGLGCDPKCLRTLKRHSALDPGHRDALADVLDALPVGPELRGAIGLSALQTARQATVLFSELADRPLDEGPAASRRPAPRPPRPGS